MKKIFLLIALISFFLIPFANESFAQSKKKSYKPKTVRVRGYTTKKGKYVLGLALAWVTQYLKQTKTSKANSNVIYISKYG